MGTIQTNIGLVTGMDIGSTVDKLMQLASVRRNNLDTRTTALKTEQAAINQLAALLLSVQYASDNLGKTTLFDKRQATSSNPSVLSVTVSGQPPKGSYQYTPLQMVQSHQLLSSGVQSKTESLGAGTLTFRFGDHVQRSADLQSLNGGEGATRGKIRITDRSGASEVIDLSTAQTIDDVLEAINSATTINVTAVGHGDCIRLVDNTGLELSNLKVQEVGAGTTAASLGLDQIDVEGPVADGKDVLWLSNNLDLLNLNDGNGVAVNDIFKDIHYELRDGTTKGDIDLSPIIVGGSQVDREITLGDMLEHLNAAAPGKLQFSIAPDGDRLIATDLSEDLGGTFSLSPLFDSGALHGLGLDGEAVDSVITGHRILGGIKTVLLSSLGGGSGLGTLGTIDLTNRHGDSKSIDLSGAETLDDVIDAINAANISIRAEVNKAKNGLLLTDTTGMTTSNLIVANGDATNTADKLGIAVDDAVNSVNSGDLHLQIISQTTRLDDLNGGAGVATGKIRIFDTTGAHADLNITSSMQTIDDVLEAINNLPLQVHADLNATGDGILLQDLAHGTKTLQVYAVEGNSAKDLGLLHESQTVDIEGVMTQVIDGSMTHSIQLEAGDSLANLVTEINNANAGVRAMIMEDGSTKPYRVILMSEEAGNAGALVVDDSGLGLAFDETVKAQDALLAFGAGATSSSILISSSSNSFQQVLPGAALTINQPSSTPVTVTVTTTDEDLVATMQAMVDNYNKFRTTLAQLTTYNVDTDTRAALTGDVTALQANTQLTSLMWSKFLLAGPIQSLTELGIRVQNDGTLTFDADTLKEKHASDPDAVEKFFTTKDFGFSAKLGKLLEQLAGDGNSLLTSRSSSLADKIQWNEDRIGQYDEQLDKQRQRLLLQFYRMEIAIGKLQSNLNALAAIKPLEPLTSSSSSNN